MDEGLQLGEVNMSPIRCDWVPLQDKLYVEYHDEEWGVPLYDDQKLFEFLILEGFQAGLSWRTILYKRTNFRTAFDNFNAEKIAGYNELKFNSLMNDAGIIRNRLKIHAAITNARSFLKIKDKYSSFSAYMWRFTDGKPLVNQWKKISQVPPKTDLSDKISKDLLQHGFKFVGSTVVYAHMQATGMVNDHLVTCFRHQQVIG